MCKQASNNRLEKDVRPAREAREPSLLSLRVRRHGERTMQGSVVIQVQPATVVMTGIEFMQYGDHYLNAAEYLAAREPNAWFDPLPYQLLCQSLELHLKSFIWLADRLSRKTIKKRKGDILNFRPLTLCFRPTRNMPPEHGVSPMISIGVVGLRCLKLPTRYILCRRSNG